MTNAQLDLGQVKAMGQSLKGQNGLNNSKTLMLLDNRLMAMLDI